MPPKPPNLLYVFPDQFRQASLGLWSRAPYQHHHQGLPDPVHTPNLDAFAQQACVLTHAVSNFPVCSPHRGSLFSGCYPNKSGVPLNCHSGRPISNLPSDQQGFTDILAQQGYSVGYIGKWHLDWPTANDPEHPGEYVDPNRPAWDSYTEPHRRHGIDYWYGYGTFDQHHNPHYYDNQGKRHQPNQWSAEHEASQAVAYLDNLDGQRDPNKPFALFVAMNPPHSPYHQAQDCSAEDLPRYQHLAPYELLRRENAKWAMDKARCAPYYFANVSGVDRQFGRIIDRLIELDEWENTLIVFTSDHGETLCSHGLSDAKNSIFHESFCVPFIAKLPHQRAGTINPTLLSSPDIMPTVLALLGVEHLPTSQVQGHNLAAFIKSETDNRNVPLGPKSALYIRNIDGEVNPSGNVISYFAQSRGVKTHRYTLALTINPAYQLEQILFFDDELDPYQQHNLTFDPHGTVERDLLQQLADELSRIDDPWANLGVLADMLTYTRPKQKANHDQ